MKKLILLMLMGLPMLAAAQSTVTPDTVCYQTNGSTYSVTSDPGVTYNWSVAAPGVITSGQGTSSIGVNWSSANPGLIPNAVTVTVTNQTYSSFRSYRRSRRRHPA
jgi:hypothetical protein